MRFARVVISVALGVGACIVWHTARASRTANVDCQGPAPVVVVDTSHHVLGLCDGGRSVESFDVRLGRHGTGKRREGDGKTPLGTYGLGDPVASAAYGLFIPVGYPTEDQRRLGFTGSAIGVHGPTRGARWLGSWVNFFDTTDGCVGIATDAEMRRIADFTRAHHARRIVIE
jgi:L,D-peptidoglycan transpeptidase YkuD (ErfK/YbiS/YcfS/YnhG family)